MNKFVLCLSFIIMSLAVSAQKVYFIYIQSEQEQPFFVKMNEKVYSSTASGYLILSKLHDSTYHFTVGFPNEKFPEQKFSVVISRKDHGYLLKNFGEKGWGLFNLQTLAVQMAEGEKKTSAIKTEKMAEVSAFTEILARAADDSTLRERPVMAKVEEKKPAETAKTTPDAPPVATRSPEIKKDDPVITIKDTQATRQAETAAVKTAEPATTPKNNTIAKEEPKEEIKAPPLVQEQPKEATYKRSVVTRQSESSTADGLSLTFIDESSNGTRDTIQITIPPAKPPVAEVKDTPKQERKFLDITSDKKEDDQPAKTVAEPVKPVTTDTPAVTPSSETGIATPKVRANDCKEQAGDKDFLALRKKMAAETDDDDMIDQARQYFRRKCFTTAQLKNLSVLFLDDLGKYKFLEASYLFVSDKENFSTLQSELKNDYYVNRFKTLTNQ